MMGYRNPLPTMYTGTFKGTFVKSSGMEFFVAARAEFRESGFVLESSSTQAIWCQDSCIGANALVQVGSDLEQLQNGDKVSFLFINPW
jgi:molybdopterin biosynthesis enzyme